MSDTTTDDEHPVYDHFRAAGYPPDVLTDPGNVTSEDIKEGGWRVVVWNTHGVFFYDVDGDDIVEEDRSPAGVSVEYSNGTQQPIDFAEESGLLNDELRPMSQMRGMANHTVTYFAAPDVERTFPDYTEREAVEALGYWGSEGHIPQETVEAIADAFGLGTETVYYTDDEDAEGVELARADHVAKHIASGVLGESKSEDSDISGHKKRRRQSFCRNLDVLKDEYGIEE